MSWWRWFKWRTKNNHSDQSTEMCFNDLITSQHDSNRIVAPIERHGEKVVIVGECRPLRLGDNLEGRHQRFMASGSHINSIIWVPSLPVNCLSSIIHSEYAFDIGWIHDIRWRQTTTSRVLSCFTKKHQESLSVSAWTQRNVTRLRLKVNLVTHILAGMYLTYTGEVLDAVKGHTGK